MSTTCNILPVSAFQSTNLNSKINTFGDLGDRIKRSLGYPLITLEIHQDQLFNNIQIAIEYFSKFAGYTQEFLIFDSRLYEKNKGIRLDHLYTLARQGVSYDKKLAKTNSFTSPDFVVDAPKPVYVAQEAILGDQFLYPDYTPGAPGDPYQDVDFGDWTDVSIADTLSPTGMHQFQVIEEDLYRKIQYYYHNTLKPYFRKSIINKPALQSANAIGTEPAEYSNVFDYDALDYRKVVSVTGFEEGSNQGINTLFTLEQTLAQQTYFSYALGNYGFDLVSWYTLKEWMEMREKVLATRRDIKFDERTQYLQMYPQPGSSRFYGVISCYLERPIRDLIKEQWVYEYAVALSKITIGRVRSKFGGVSLLGGGSLNYDLLTEGLNEKKELEEKLLTGAAAGFGDADPPMFFVA